MNRKALQGLGGLDAIAETYYKSYDSIICEVLGAKFMNTRPGLLWGLLF